MNLKRFDSQKNTFKHIQTHTNTYNISQNEHNHTQKTHKHGKKTRIKHNMKKNHIGNKYDTNNTHISNKYDKKPTQT